jgi:stress response protein SCP2
LSTALVKGQNMSLAIRQLRVTVQVAHAADLSALLVTASGKVRTDADFIFFNQPNGPGVSCHQPAGGQPWRIDLDLDRVPADIDRVRVVSSLDGNNVRFGQFAAPVARVTDLGGGPVAEYTMTGLDTESIVIVVEAYRRQGQWKLRAVGQGYAGGLADLVTDHGVSVDDAGPAASQPAPATSAPPSRPPVTPPPAPPTPPLLGPPAAPTQPAYQSPPAYQMPAAPPTGQMPAAPPTGQMPAAPQYPAPPGQYPPPQPPYQAPPTGPIPAQPPPGQYPAQAPPGQYPPPAQYPPPGQYPAQPPPGQYPPQPPTGQFPAAPPTGQVPAPPGQAGPAGESVAQPGRPVNLSKGQRVSLQKNDGTQLTLVRMGVGWDPIKKRGLFGSREQEIDLDASAVLFADHQPVDIAFFNHLRSNDGSVMHTGDNRTGAGDGDDESIMVELSRVPAHVNTIFFVVTSYEGQTFQQIENAFCRLVDESTRGELARYTLSGGAPYTAMVMAKVYRDGGAWKMQAIGEGAQGRTALDLVPHLVRLTH